MDCNQAHVQTASNRPHRGLPPSLAQCAKSGTFPLKTGICTIAMQPISGAGTSPVRPLQKPGDAHEKSHPGVALFLHRTLEQPCGYSVNSK